MLEQAHTHPAQAAPGAGQAQLRAELGLNCEFRTGSQHQLNTAHTELWTAKKCLLGEGILSPALRVIPASSAKDRGESKEVMGLQSLFWDFIKSKQM